MDKKQIVKILKAQWTELVTGGCKCLSLGNNCPCHLCLIDRLSETEQNSHKHGVMQAEGSDVSEGAAVGNIAAGQSGSDGVMKWCDSCGKITKWIDGNCHNYKTRGGSAKGALPR